MAGCVLMRDKKLKLNKQTILNWVSKVLNHNVFLALLWSLFHIRYFDMIVDFVIQLSTLIPMVYHISQIGQQGPLSIIKSHI